PRLNAPLRHRHGPRAKQAAADDARQRRTDEIGRCHEQHGLYRQRNHLLTPHNAPLMTPSRLAPCAARTRAIRPRSQVPAPPAATRRACKRDSPLPNPLSWPRRTYPSRPHDDLDAAIPGTISQAVIASDRTARSEAYGLQLLRIGAGLN